PEYRSHRAEPREKRTDNHQNYPLGALHKTNLTRADQRLRTGTCVADHHGADHHESHQHQIKEVIGAGVVNQKSEEQSNVTVAIDDGIEKSTESSYLVSGASYPAVHHIEDPRADNHQPRIEKHSWIVVRVSVTKQDSSDSVDHQTNEGKHIG